MSRERLREKIARHRGRLTEMAGFAELAADALLALAGIARHCASEMSSWEFSPQRHLDKLQGHIGEVEAVAVEARRVKAVRTAASLIGAEQAGILNALVQVDAYDRQPGQLPEQWDLPGMNGESNDETD